ncbi:MAG: tetratricopeptide repeat protein [Myxococcota bacterium]
MSAWCALVAVSPLDDANRAFEESDYRSAARLYETIRAKHRLTYAQNIQLHERIGIAYATLGDKQKAEDAFARLVTMAPEHALSYSWSPKVTFVFERAREKLRAKGPPNIQLNWPTGLAVDQPLPVSVRVFNDPLDEVRRGSLVVRRDQGRPARFRFEVAGNTTVEIPPPAAPLRHDSILEFYVLAEDSDGTELYRIGSPKALKRASTIYTEPPRWYERWYWWAGAGLVMATAAGTTAYFLTNSPPERVPIIAQPR